MNRWWLLLATLLLLVSHRLVVASFRVVASRRHQRRLRLRTLQASVVARTRVVLDQVRRKVICIWLHSMVRSSRDRASWHTPLSNVNTGRPTALPVVPILEILVQFRDVGFRMSVLVRVDLSELFSESSVSLRLRIRLSRLVVRRR